jgi:hypothetical protein
MNNWHYNRVKAQVFISIFVIAFAYFFFFDNEYNYNQESIIYNVKRKQTINLEKFPSSTNNVVSLKINISGNIKGIAKISLLENNQTFKSKIIKDNFSININSEWYSSNATLLYKPINVKYGEIKIKYSFEEI